MARLVARKLLHMVCVLLIVSLAITFLINLTPGDPAYSILGDTATKAQVFAVHEALHLNDPFYVRYWDWLTGLLHGNFGTSFLTHLSVISLIGQAVPVTAELIIVAFIIAIVLSIPIGIYTAYRSDGRFDRAWGVVSSGLISMPPFVSALILVYVFALLLRNFAINFPATGWVNLGTDFGGNLRDVTLPAVAMALSLIPAYSRLLRADMIATLQEDYILAARAKGAPPRQILMVHALRQSCFSLITLAGLSLGQLISSAAVIEVLFALPGLGQLLVNSISSKDIPVVQGVVMFIAVVYVVLNMLVDLAYSYLDPRVRLEPAV